MARESTLVKANVDFVTEYWPNFVPCLTEMKDEDKTVLLAGIQSGLYDLWVAVNQDDTNRSISGFLITTKYLSTPAGDHTLFIYYVYGFESVSTNMWTQGMEKLSKHARDIGCTKIVATTPYLEVVNRAKSLGFSVEHFLLKEV